MTEEQANDLAHSEWQARKASSQAAVDEAAIEPPVSIESMNAYGYTGSDKVQ